MAEPPLVRWRDLLWLAQNYPLYWITRITPIRWLPMTERFADRAIQIVRRTTRRKAAERMQVMLGISTREAGRLSRRLLEYSIRVTHIERRLRRSRDLSAEPVLQLIGQQHLDKALAAKKGALL